MHPDFEKKAPKTVEVRSNYSYQSYLSPSPLSKNQLHVHFGLLTIH